MAFMDAAPEQNNDETCRSQFCSVVTRLPPDGCQLQMAIYHLLFCHVAHLAFVAPV